MFASQDLQSRTTEYYFDHRHEIWAGGTIFGKYHWNSLLLLFLAQRHKSTFLDAEPSDGVSSPWSTPESNWVIYSTLSP
jgi:hypothetical protein